MVRAAALMTLLAGSVASGKGDDDSGTNPIVVLDLFAAASLSQIEVTELSNVDVADLGSVINWIHTEVVVESLRGPATGSGSRIDGLDGIATFRFKVRNPRAVLEETGHSFLSDFGPYVVYNHGQASRVADLVQATVGDFVGVTQQLDQRFPLPEDLPVFRVSLPGRCPNLPNGQKGGDGVVNETCLTYNGSALGRPDQSYVLGGLCRDGADMELRLPRVDPNGMPGCAYSYGKPVSVQLDQLVGITDEDCGGRKCTDWADWRTHCTEERHKKRFSYLTLASEDVDHCVEYDIHPSCAHDCGVAACMQRRARGEDIETGLAFWRGRCDAEANKRRMERVFTAIGFKGYEVTKLLVDEEVLAAPASCHRSESATACRPDGTSGGPYCFRGFSGMCQPCFVPNASNADSFRQPVCPFAALKVPDYSNASSELESLRCRSKRVADLCCLYKSSDADSRCEGDDDPHSATFDDDGLMLVAARQSTTDMATFFERVVRERLDKHTSHGFEAWAAEQWHATPRLLSFEQAVRELEDCEDCSRSGGDTHDFSWGAAVMVVCSVLLVLLICFLLLFCKGRFQRKEPSDLTASLARQSLQPVQGFRHSGEGQAVSGEGVAERMCGEGGFRHSGEGLVVSGEGGGGGVDGAQEKKRVLIVGEAGAGKTCLVRLLRGVNLVDKPEGVNSFITNDVVSLQSLAAEEGSTKSIKQVDVTVGGCDMCLIDTPGFADNSGTPADGREDLAHSRLLAEALRGAEFLHCVLLVINGTQARMNPSVGHTLKILQKHMPREFLQKTIVVFTYVESENRRPFPVEQLAGVVFDGESPKDRLVHLENPLGQLAGMNESDLRAKLDGDDAEARDDLRREIKKGAKVANDLARMIQGFPATRCSASRPACCCQ